MKAPTLRAGGGELGSPWEFFSRALAIQRDLNYGTCYSTVSTSLRTLEPLQMFPKSPVIGEAS